MIRVPSTVEHLGKLGFRLSCQKILDTGLQNSMTLSTSKGIYMCLHYYKNGVKGSGNNNHFLITHNQPFSINLWTLWTIVHCPCLFIRALKNISKPFDLLRIFDLENIQIAAYYKMMSLLLRILVILLIGANLALKWNILLDIQNNSHCLKINYFFK